MFSEFHFVVVHRDVGVRHLSPGLWNELMVRKLSFVKCLYIDFFSASHGASLLKFTLVVNHDTSMHAVHTCTVAFSPLP